jgi:ADP-ribosylglycohydrolase
MDSAPATLPVLPASPDWAVLDPLESIAEADRRMRGLAVPIDRRVVPDRWQASDFADVSRESMLREFWGAPVPGSGAWDSMLLGAANSHIAHCGFEDPMVRGLISSGLQARHSGDDQRCVSLAEQLLAVFASTTYEPGPVGVDPSRARLPRYGGSREDRLVRVQNGWVGQIAGGAFGTALEGCTGQALDNLYRRLDAYVGEVSTLNDDCVYEILALEVLERYGAAATTENYAHKWSTRLPFGWSAEWITLDNLAASVAPSVAGQQGNPMFDWIGAQMRSMIFGLVAPGDVDTAVALALPEAAVSHRGGGLAGAAFAAALTSGAFVVDDPRELLERVVPILDGETSYGNVVHRSLNVVTNCRTSQEVFGILDAELTHRNWIHAEPNIAAVICALWFCEGDFTTAMALLAGCGLDVDCNAGLVGTILGIQNRAIPNAWSEPLGGFVDTYLGSGDRYDIASLAQRTAALQLER